MIFILINKFIIGKIIINEALIHKHGKINNFHTGSRAIKREQKAFSVQSSDKIANTPIPTNEAISIFFWFESSAKCRFLQSPSPFLHKTSSLEKQQIWNVEMGSLSLVVAILNIWNWNICAVKRLHILNYLVMNFLALHSLHDTSARMFLFMHILLLWWSRFPQCALNGCSYDVSIHDLEFLNRTPSLSLQLKVKRCSLTWKIPTKSHAFILQT